MRFSILYFWMLLCCAIMAGCQSTTVSPTMGPDAVKSASQSAKTLPVNSRFTRLDDRGEPLKNEA